MLKCHFDDAEKQNERATVRTKIISLTALCVVQCVTAIMEGLPREITRRVNKWSCVKKGEFTRRVVLSRVHRPGKLTGANISRYPSPSSSRERIPPTPLLPRSRNRGYYFHSGIRKIIVGKSGLLERESRAKGLDTHTHIHPTYTFSSRAHTYA